MNTATAVTTVYYPPIDYLPIYYLPVQERSESCQIIPFQPLGKFSIYCNGVLHTEVRGTIFAARNRMITLSNSHPEHYWSVG